MRTGVLVIGIGVGAALASPVRAQAAQDEVAAEATDAKTLDAVTVTSRRREESAQRVPIAVTALDALDLQDLQADSVAGLQGAAPNVNIVQGRGSASSANVFIRGIGQPDALPTFDPGVGMYIDDVYYSRIQGALFNLFDVERVEVLRGPQGTLYGKNSTGGAIRIVTREPDEVASAQVEAAVGDHGRAELRGYAAAPLGEGVAASLAVIGTDNDGYVRDSAGRHYNDDGSEAARLKLVLRPREAFSATISADYTHQSNAPALGNPEAPLFQTELATGARRLLLSPRPGDYDFISDTSLAPDSRQRLTHQGLAAALSFGGDGAWRLKSISAYRDLEATYAIDIDASAFRLGDTLATLDQHQWSQELQLQYDAGGALRTVYGLYYLQEKFDGGQDVTSDDLLTFMGLPVPYRTVSDEHQTTRSAAAFAQVDWDFAPAWTLSAGLRYTRERKEYARNVVAITGLPPLDNEFAFRADASWSAWTPSLSLTRAFGEHVTGYLSANRGFKSGGFNGRASSEAETAPFDPEYVWTYELGLKTQSGNGRLRGNFTAFHSDYRDFQARVADVTDPDSPTPSFVFPVLNAARVAIDGVEFEGVALFGEGVRLSAQLGWMNARYERFDDPRVALDPALAGLHDHVPFSPRWTAQLALSRTFWLGNGSTLTTGGDVSWRDETWLSVDNRDALRQPAHAVLGAFARWDSPDGRWQLRAGVRNLTDEVYRTDAQEFSSVGNVQTAYYGWPRHYTLAVRYGF